MAAHVGFRKFGSLATFAAIRSPNHRRREPSQNSAAGQAHKQSKD
jgi:hypothetical protein